jgi:hypothetical protein
VVHGKGPGLDVRFRLHDVFSWFMVCVIPTCDASGPGLPSPAWRLLEKMQKIRRCVPAAEKKCMMHSTPACSLLCWSCPWRGVRVCHGVERRARGSWRSVAGGSAGVTDGR